MKIPHWILIYLPKKLQDKHTQLVWNNRTDKDIMSAYEDAQGWIDISKGVFESKTTLDIAYDCKNRLDKWIIPQMIKRGLK